MLNEIQVRINRKSYIEDIKKIPSEILKFQKFNKKLTRIERMVSAFLQDCLRLKIISGCITQKIIKMGAGDEYIMVDFFLQTPEVIIEVDGPEHSKNADDRRDRIIKDLFNYEVVRVTNKQVTEDNKGTRIFLLKSLAKAHKLSNRKTSKLIKRYWEYKKL